MWVGKYVVIRILSAGVQEYLSAGVPECLSA